MSTTDPHHRAAALIEALRQDLQAGRGPGLDQYHYDRLLNDGLEPDAAMMQIQRLRLALSQCHADGLDLDAALVARAYRLLPMAHHEPFLHLLVEAGHVDPKR